MGAVASGQFHLDATTYLDAVRAAVPAYDELQQAVALAAHAVPATRVLDLGTGTGETARRVLDVHPDASLVAIDASPEMVALASTALPEADVRIGGLEDALPPGPFDLVISALAVHHLPSAEKAQLFQRIAEALEPQGRLVLADVVVPEAPGDAVTPLEPGVDLPDSVSSQLGWLADAGLEASLFWQQRDLAVLTADAP